MTKRLLSFVLPAILAALAAVPACWAQGQAAFISGGIGDDSAARMASVGKEYNFKLLFAAKDGHYLGDVAVTISDARNSKVLETVSEGPFLFVRLAPGKYQVTANYAGASQTRATTIAATGRRELIFRWEEQPESPAATQ